MSKTPEEEAAMWLDINAIRRDIADMKLDLAEIKNMLGETQFKPASTLPQKEPSNYAKDYPDIVNKKQEPTEDSPPSVEQLNLVGVNMYEDLDYGDTGMLITTRRKLETELYNNYNAKLKGLGYKWKSDKKTSTYGWEYLGEQKPQPQTLITNPAKLERGKYVTLRGTLIDDPIQKDIDTSRGPATVASFRMNIGEGDVRVSLWDDHAEAIMDYAKGTKVEITSLNVKDLFDGLVQVSSAKYTKVTTL